MLLLRVSHIQAYSFLKHCKLNFELQALPLSPVKGQTVFHQEHADKTKEKKPKLQPEKNELMKLRSNQPWKAERGIRMNEKMKKCFLTGCLLKKIPNTNLQHSIKIRIVY